MWRKLECKVPPSPRLWHLRRANKLTVYHLVRHGKRGRSGCHTSWIKIFLVTPFSRKTSVTWGPYRGQKPSRCLVPNCTPSPLPPRLFFVPLCMLSLHNARLIHQNTCTRVPLHRVPLQQWAPFSARPALHCFPLGARRQAFFFFFVDTFNKTAQRCHDSLLKTKVSVMRRGIKAKATPTLAWYEATWGWNSNAHLRKLLFWQLDYWRVIRPQFKRDYRHSHTHHKTYKTFGSQVDSSESYLSRSTVLCCKFPQVPPVCSLLFSCKLVVFSQRDVPCQGLRPRRCGLVLYSASARWQMGSLLSSRAMQRAVQTWV